MSKICKVCGTMLSDDARFCGECGTNMGAASGYSAPEPERVPVDIIQPPRRERNGVAADSREVRERLVGTKTEYYLPRFETMETLNSTTSWNWAAFLFSTGWMMYRKMYAYGAVLFVVSNVLAMLSLGFLSLVLSIGVGILGNYLYMKDINNRTEKAMNMQPEAREMFIQKNSGTSWIPVIVLCLAGFALSLLMI